MDYPKNYDEWWIYLESNWDDILYFADKIGIDLMSKVWYDGSIIDDSVLSKLNKMKNEKDMELLAVMQKIYNHAPDSNWIQGEQGFHSLCYLCSEGYFCLCAEE